MRLRSLSFLLVPLIAALAARQDSGPARAPLAGAVDAGELDFEVLDPAGTPIPARLTFFAPEQDGPGKGVPDLFTEVEAAPLELAARRNVVYSKSGRARITVPVGRWVVYASRGPEWSLARTELEIRADRPAAWRAQLVHEVDTSGWVSGDFHLHTLTYSGHGDANLRERVLSFLGEGLEFAVATDHNHHTDYGPTVRELGVSAGVATITGNEVSTPIGHFNAFPLDPARAPVDSSLRDANALFRLIRAETNPLGVAPVIQLNHPRWEGIDYFTRTGLDPIDGNSTQAAYSPDFDSIELLNENVSWGYFDPIDDRRDTGNNRHSVLTDWFHLLNRGQRYAGVGNSDSHTVNAAFAGYPRNYVRSSSDEPGDIQSAEVAEAVRSRAVFTSVGPFLRYTVEGVEMGGDALAREGHARLNLAVQAASWIACDRVIVVQNGERVASLPVPDVRTPLRLETTLELCLLQHCPRHGRPASEGGATSAQPSAVDAWVTLLVEGDRPLFPLLIDEAQPALPLAVANPVWIDGDGDGRWTSPLERVGAELRSQPTPALALGWFETLTPSEQVLVLGAVPRGPFAAALVTHGLDSPSRAVRLAATRATERCAVGNVSASVEKLWRENPDDPYLSALALRVLVASRPESAPSSLVAFQQRFGEAGLRRYAGEFSSLLRGGELRAWSVLGHLELDAPEALSQEAPSGAAGQAHLGRGGVALDWRVLETGPDSAFLDLGLLAAPGASVERVATLAQCWLHVDTARSVLCALGTDDGCRVWLNDVLLYDNPASRTADPLEKLLTLELRAGWNRLLFRVVNQGGDYGLYCQVFDPSVRSSPTR